MLKLPEVLKAKMIHYQNNTEFVNACKKRGFVHLDWIKDVTDPITGNNTERAELKGEYFKIDVVLAHPLVVNPQNQKHFDNTRFTRVEIYFRYLTKLGEVFYRQVHEDRPFERAKEYAEWQATLIYEMLSCLERNNFNLEA